MLKKRNLRASRRRIKGTIATASLPSDTIILLHTVREFDGLAGFAVDFLAKSAVTSGRAGVLSQSPS